MNAAFTGDFDTAFREFSLAAQQGLDLAQYNLAILYFTGQGVDQDYEQAFRWTEAAAVQGHINAQANLASLYLEGTGVRGMSLRRSTGFLPRVSPATPVRP